MRPEPGIVKGGVPEKERAQVLAEPGKAYAIYLTGGRKANLEIELPPGRYRAEWVSPLTGTVEGSREFEHPGGAAVLASPEYPEDIALRIRRR